MGGHGWAEVVVDGCGLGMGTNSKEMLGSCLKEESTMSWVGGWKHGS